MQGGGSYRNGYKKYPKSGEGTPFLINRSYYKENGVTFLIANFSGRVERPWLYYFGDDEQWHPSPMLLSEGKYIAMIAPQKQKKVKYYITLEDENMTYRFPLEEYYELEN